MAFFKPIMTITGIIAGLCLPLLLFWLMGVPGVDNEYARGWKMGLNVLFFYPTAWLGNYVIYFIVKSFISDDLLQSWQLVSGGIAITIFVLAVLRMIQAFIIIIG